MDLSNGSSFIATFAANRGLRKIGTLTVSEKMKETSNMFQLCDALKDITFAGTIPCSLSFAWSPLSVDSMKSIIEHLKNYSDTDNAGKYTITFTNKCWTKLEASVLSPVGGTWKEYVTNTLGWLV